MTETTRAPLLCRLCRNEISESAPPSGVDSTRHMQCPARPVLDFFDVAEVDALRTALQRERERAERLERENAELAEKVEIARGARDFQAIRAHAAEQDAARLRADIAALKPWRWRTGTRWPDGVRSICYRCEFCGASAQSEDCVPKHPDNDCLWLRAVTVASAQTAQEGLA